VCETQRTSATAGRPFRRSRANSDAPTPAAPLSHRANPPKAIASDKPIATGTAIHQAARISPKTSRGTTAGAESQHPTAQPRRTSQVPGISYDACLPVAPVASAMARW
jgi:hypothetical protein